MAAITKNLFFDGEDNIEKLETDIRGLKKAILKVEQMPEIKRKRKNLSKSSKQLKRFWNGVLKAYRRKLAEIQKELEEMEIKCYGVKIEVDDGDYILEL